MQFSLRVLILAVTGDQRADACTIIGACYQIVVCDEEYYKYLISILHRNYRKNASRC